jgi:hypothetical protein
MLHHSLARIVSQSLLEKWRVDFWPGSKISNGVILGRGQVVFPSPDATFIDNTKQLTITMEFKPPTSSKREILTGLGQAISYLDFSSMSYLAIPETIVDNFNIKEYMCNLFENRGINSKFPIGLVVYKNDNPLDLEIVKEIDNDLNPRTMTDNRNVGSYWATYKDSNPHTIWLLLDIAYNLDERTDRKDKIWEEFFDNYYCPKNKKYNGEECVSNVNHWNEGFGKGFSETFKPLKDDFKDNRITLGQLTQEIDNIIGKNNTGDSLYKSYSKNRMPLLAHLGLWDEQYYLTESGYDLHKTGKIYGPNSNVFKDKLAKIILIEGKHLDLILDIENSTRNKNFNSVGDAKKEVTDQLEDKGLIKRNPNRSPDPNNAKDDFESEFQLWNKVGFVLKQGRSFYIKNKGFNFDWSEITRILSL